MPHWSDRLNLRARWRQWWEAQRRPCDSWTLTQRNVYILPTRAGLFFGVTVVVLLLASINYQLSLGFALSFLLAGSAVASMHMTHASLRGLTLHLKPVAPTFAGADGHLDLVVTNPGRRRFGIGFGLHAGEGPAVALAYEEIAAARQTVVQLGWFKPVRGAHPLPPVRLESRFPFGLFKAWSTWHPAGELWVYPKPEPAPPPWPATDAAEGGEQRDTRQAGAEFDGVRAYRRGDTPRQVVWKKAARTGELVSRDTASGMRRELWLQWRQAALADPEARLERLCAWVLAADLAGCRYGLRLPGVELPPAVGPDQRHAALRALAQW